MGWGGGGVAVLFLHSLAFLECGGKKKKKKTVGIRLNVDSRWWAEGGKKKKKIKNNKRVKFALAYSAKKRRVETEFRS